MKNKKLLIGLAITAIIAIVIILILKNRKNIPEPKPETLPISLEEKPVNTGSVFVGKNEIILSEPLAKELKASLN